MNTLAAHVNVYETDISKIKVGQPAIITVGALRGRSYPAHVARISPMASSENRWLNPDVMVYETDVALDNVPMDGSLTAGMSATAQIIVAQLKNVIYVPVQAVTTYQGQRICYVKGPTGPERRTVTTGYFTDKFVEITKGLNEGETVYLAPPPEMAQDANAASKQPAGQDGRAGHGRAEHRPADRTDRRVRPGRSGRASRRRGRPARSGRPADRPAGSPRRRNRRARRHAADRPAVSPEAPRAARPERRRSATRRCRRYIKSLPEDQRAQVAADDPAHDAVRRTWRDAVKAATNGNGGGGGRQQGAGQ